MDIGGIIAALFGIILGIYYFFWLLFLIIHEWSLRGAKKTESIVIKYEDMEEEQFDDEDENVIPRNFVKEEKIKFGCFGWAFFMPFILIGIFLIYGVIRMTIDDYFTKKRRIANEKIFVQEMTRRNDHLGKACEQDSKIVVYQKISAGYGMYLSDGHYSGNKEKEVLEQKRQAEFEQCKIDMGRIVKEKGGRIDEKDYCREKYFTVVKFLDNFSPPWGGGEWKIASHAAFFEYIGEMGRHENIFVAGVALKEYLQEEKRKREDYYDQHGIVLREYDYLVRFATKKWWMDSGLGDIASQWMKRYIDDMHLENIKDEDFVDDEIPVSHLMSHYHFNIEDISTIDDAHKGIRRGRISLVDMRNQQLMAEYITFDLIPFYHNYPARSEKHCLNLAKKSEEMRPESYDDDEVFAYFFRHVVDETQSMPVQKADRL